MKTLRVRDIMTTEVQTLPANASIEDAARFMTEARISGVPVTDGGRIIGVVSKSDLANPGNWPTEGAMPTVRSVMTPVIYAVRPGDPVMSAVRLMVLENIHRAIVVSDKGDLSGIVTPMDVMRALARGECVQEGDFATTESEKRRHGEPEVGVGFVDLRTFEIVTTDV